MIAMPGLESPSGSSPRVQPFDAVASDFRMPGMDGLSFLKALAGLEREEKFSLTRHVKTENP